MFIDYNTGRIDDIINGIQNYENKSIEEIPAGKKLDYLTHCLQLSVYDFDLMILQNSPLLRTIKGHVFETFFDHLLIKNNINFTAIGGDEAIDRIVNNFTLQLKTPTESGTTSDRVQYKTHKTHGAKSERESLSYYFAFSDFADYLIGLVSYEPLNILLLDKNDLPEHIIDNRYIRSPFTVFWKDHPGLNNFSRIGIYNKINPLIFAPSDFDLLKNTSCFLRLPSSYIIETIFKKGNFRIWDMTIRGFAREVSFINILRKNNISMIRPEELKKERADKADVAVNTVNGYKLLQIKGISTTKCGFNQINPLLVIETMLTRGRINDHPTQSRLYYVTDFDFLVLCLEPAIVSLCQRSIGKPITFQWEYYIIPVDMLNKHRSYPNRINSMQYFNYSELQKFKINNHIFNF